MSCCRALRRKAEALRTAWSLDRFGSDATVAAGTDRAVKSDWFWAYNDFICVVSGSLEELSSWTEGCPCHADLHLTTRGYEARRRKIAEKIWESVGYVGDPVDKLPNCCLKGRRATEFASGQFDVYLEDLNAVAKQEVEKTTSPLPRDQRAQLLGDWLSACETLVEIMKPVFASASMNFNLDQSLGNSIF